jgi:hypothetical protein
MPTSVARSGRPFQAFSTGGIAARPIASCGVVSAGQGSIGIANGSLSIRHRKQNPDREAGKRPPVGDREAEGGRAIDANELDAETDRACEGQEVSDTNLPEG